MSEPSSDRDGDISTRSLFAGASWRTFGYTVTMLAKFSTTPVLARLLDERDFGLAALSFAIILFFMMIGYAGLPQALIVARKDDWRLWSSAFWANLTIGIAFALLALAAAPALAGLEHTPEAARIVQAFALLIPLQLVHSIAWARLMRDQRHSRLAGADMASEILGAVCAIAAAFAGWGVWSLVLQQYVALGVRSVIYFHRSGLTIRPHFAWSDIKPYAGFSARVTLTDLCSYVVQNLPVLLIGRFLSPATAGVYEVGRRLAHMPNWILTSSLTQTLLPAFARLREDPERLRNALKTAIRYSAAVTAPVFIGLAAVGEPATLFMFGERWHAAAPVVTFAALTFCLRGLLSGAAPYFNGVEAPGRTLIMYGMQGVAVAFGAVVGMQWGASAASVAAGMFFAEAAASVVIFALWMRHAGIGALEGFGQLARPLLAASAMGALVWLGLQTIPVLEGVHIARLILAGAAGAVLYGAFMLLIDKATALAILRLVLERAPMTPAPLRRWVGLEA